MIELREEEEEERHIHIPTRQFLRTRRADILTRRSRKVYRCNYAKGRTLGAASGYLTRPFGWNAPEEEEEE